MVKTRFVIVPLCSVFLFSALGAAQAGAAGEYAKHFDALSKLSVAVAEAMPADQYTFKPHPESISAN